MPGMTGPIVPRRRLGEELERLRQADGRTLEQVASTTLISTSKLSRLENGQGSPQPRDVRDLLREYGVDRGRRRAAHAVVNAARRQGWWSDYSFRTKVSPPTLTCMSRTSQRRQSRAPTPSRSFRPASDPAVRARPVPVDGTVAQQRRGRATGGVARAASRLLEPAVNARRSTWWSCATNRRFTRWSAPRKSCRTSCGRSTRRSTGRTCRSGSSRTPESPGPGSARPATVDGPKAAKG